MNVRRFGHCSAEAPTGIFWILDLVIVCYLFIDAWNFTMENHKSQIPNLKQIPITETPNSKLRCYKDSPFGSFDIGLLILFACPVGSMRPYQGYLMLVIWSLFVIWCL
ncbi:MAG: hypothetical protein L6422_10745 [Candidatus Marinimicrobia bacterium]|nr:hypothetical protein [Candidatus Neomarinimicrobiota bacterium]